MIETFQSITLFGTGDPKLMSSGISLALITTELELIESLSQALPLLGLLGTVSGMIQSFNVITVFGNGNARGLAGGISQTLLTTMAGLVTALSGL